jgi:hypothetical protein
MEQSTTAERVQADRDEGGKLGVVSTPTFFFGRRKESGEVSVISRIRGAASFETFRNELQRLLAISEQS